MRVECFARRILSPFQGLLQVLRVPGGDAESTDGRHWVLYVAHPDIVTHTGLSELRYGDWSAQQGLHRAVVRGTRASALIEQVGEQLVTGLERHAEQVPFPLIDRHECWLMDAAGEQPLVLIDSAPPGTVLAQHDAPVWQPGAAAQQEFAPLAELRLALARRVGARPKSRWIERQPDGSGMANGQCLAAEQLPWCGFSEDWTGEQNGLVQAYLDWLAPVLLTLPQLPTQRRAYFEARALRRPRIMEKLHRLYPQVQDRSLLTTALVAARLAGEPEQQQYEEPFYWPE